MKCQQCGTDVSRDITSCPTCGSAMKLEDEKLGGKKESRPVKRWIVRGVLIGVLIGGVAVFFDQLLRTFHPVIEQQPTVAMVTMYRDQKIASVPIEATMKNGAISIPLRPCRRTSSCDSSIRKKFRSFPSSRM